MSIKDFHKQRKLRRTLTPGAIRRAFAAPTTVWAGWY
jgi:hypothetical protein